MNCLLSLKGCWGYSMYWHCLLHLGHRAWSVCVLKLVQLCVSTWVEATWLPLLLLYFSALFAYFELITHFFGNVFIVQKIKSISNKCFCPGWANLDAIVLCRERLEWFELVLFLFWGSQCFGFFFPVACIYCYGSVYLLYY